MNEDGDDLDDEDDYTGDKVDEAEMKVMEQFIEKNHGNFNKISDQYKLFEYICKADPE